MRELIESLRRKHAALVRLATKAMVGKRHKEATRLDGKADGLKIALDDLVAHASQPDVFNRACGELPEGWRIEVCLEFGAGWLVLTDPDGVEHDVCPDDLTLEEQIDEAIATAVKEAK